MHLIRCVRLQAASQKPSYTFRSHIVYIYGENYGHITSKCPAKSTPQIGNSSAKPNLQKETNTLKC